MKLTTRQFAKLFLLWTILFHNNQQQQQQQQQEQQEQEKHQHYYSLQAVAEAVEFRDSNTNAKAEEQQKSMLISMNANDICRHFIMQQRRVLEQNQKSWNEIEFEFEIDIETNHTNKGLEKCLRILNLLLLNKNGITNVPQLPRYNNATAQATLLLPKLLLNSSPSLQSPSEEGKMPRKLRKCQKKYENEGTILNATTVPTYSRNDTNSISNNNGKNGHHLRYNRDVTLPSIIGATASATASATVKRLIGATTTTTGTTRTTIDEENVIVLLPRTIAFHTDSSAVQEGFDKFVEFFHVNLTNISVDFLPENDLNTFIKLLDGAHYTMVVKILNNHIYLPKIKIDNNFDGYNEQPNEILYERVREGIPQHQHLESDHLNHKLNKESKRFYETLINQNQTRQNRQQQGQELKGNAEHFMAYCDLETDLSRDFNKTVLLWPCPQMKEPGDFLPSYEAISFAINSIAKELNWTHIIIYVGDENWAFPMAIAANLQVPYKILLNGKDGKVASDEQFTDAIGSAIILTAPMTHISTLESLMKWKSLLYTKVLLIDIIAASFDAQNRFYEYLTRLPYKAPIVSNLLLLTVLSDNYRHFLNIALSNDHHGIELMQYIHHIKRWHGAYDSHDSRESQSESESANDSKNDDGAVANTPLRYENISTLSPGPDRWWNECRSWLENFTDEERILLKQQSRHCHNSSLPLSSSFNSQRLIADFEKYIAFFSFYDYLIWKILLKQQQNSSRLQKQRKESLNFLKTLPNYDFLVLAITYNRSTETDAPLGKMKTFKLRPLLILEQHEINLNTYIPHSIQPAYDDWLQMMTSVQLWHCTTFCWLIIGVGVALLLLIIAASIALGIALRNYLLRKRLSKGPNKIVLSANDFVFPVDSRRVDEGIEAMLCCWLQQLQEFGGPEVDKPDLLKGSIGSLKNLGFIIPGVTNAGSGGALGNMNGETNKLARHNPALLDMRARYNGDLVQLKEINLNSSNELKAKAMDLLVIAHGLRHENINPFIGWLNDPNRTAMVFDYCSRGSLQDVLIMDEIKLDWSFRLSLLTDLVRGMRYLHNSPLRVHGTLTSRNCVVDARWVLKITDYGLPLFYEAQGLTPPQRSAKELLWTAPEILRAMKIHQTHQPEKQHHQHHNRCSLQYHGKLMGTQSGDVYSFGIIMQEVVVRGEPYCMLSLSAEEIIMKIQKPPPLIRPSVSKGAAPPEAINIMRQCWAEQPDMRPDFNSVYERFKLLNHGRKVNFVDTMFQMLEKYSNNLEELIRERTEQLDIERKKTEQLLNRMLPSSVAEKLKLGLAVEPEEFSDVTIYFSDIVGFTTIAAHSTPVQVVDLLNDLYTIFDATINAYNVYKVETIGDAYMVVSGLPVRIPDHAEQIATMALDLLHQSGRFHVKHLPGVPVQLRIGLHTGPCCAGVVGLTMPRYCLFGDTVNTASRMESTGSSWRIHLSQETRDRLVAHGGYMIEPRGPIDIKGKGTMNTFWLLGKKDFDKPLPKPPPIGESHGLDELFIRNSTTLKTQGQSRGASNTNPSSSQSSSSTGDAVEVKVEITPAATLNGDLSANHLQNTYATDSNSTSMTNVNANVNLSADFPSKTSSSTTPQSQIISDSTMSATIAENLLNPSMNFTRLPNSTGGSSSRLYRKLEEMMDLSLPYNHYKCLSPSESNLTQFYDGKYIYSSGNSGSGRIGAGRILSSTQISSLVGYVHNYRRYERPPGSTRLLRRQYSLDRDDHHYYTNRREFQRQHIASVPVQNSITVTNSLALNAKQPSVLEVPIHTENLRSPKIPMARLHKQNSTSTAQDLEKIEEIPLSPVSSQQHSSLDSNLNKSPPSIIESITAMPSFPKLTKCTNSNSKPISPARPTATTAIFMESPPVHLISAPATPTTLHSTNGLDYDDKLGSAAPTMDTIASTVYSIQTGISDAKNRHEEEKQEQENVQQHVDLIKPELTLTVAALLTR